MDINQNSLPSKKENIQVLSVADLHKRSCFLQEKKKNLVLQYVSLQNLNFGCTFYSIVILDIFFKNFKLKSSRERLFPFGLNFMLVSKS